LNAQKLFEKNCIIVVYRSILSKKKKCSSYWKKIKFTKFLYEQYFLFYPSSAVKWIYSRDFRFRREPTYNMADRAKNNLHADQLPHMYKRLPLRRFDGDCGRNPDWKLLHSFELDRQVWRNQRNSWNKSKLPGCWTRKNYCVVHAVRSLNRCRRGSRANIWGGAPIFFQR